MGRLNRPNRFSGISRIARNCLDERSWPARIVTNGNASASTSDSSRDRSIRRTKERAVPTRASTSL
jgi:hypothetical protein